jgi:Mrp family chromosome partitioning ATPase
VVLVERANPRIDTKEEAQEALHVPVLSLVPRLGRRARRAAEHVTPEHFGGAHAESYRRLRSAIQFVSSQPLPARSGDERPEQRPVGTARSFLVVSPSPSEGKTSTVAYTAFALAEADIPALALNADSRRPTLHERLGVAPEPGLTDLAELRMDRPGIDDVAQIGPIGDLYVVASGRPGPLTTELVAAAGEVIRAGTDRGATVLVDSSPLLATADAMELVPLVDHVIMVIRNGRTTRREAVEGLELLRQRDAPLLGCVCIGAPESRRRYSSYYENDYHYSAADTLRPAATPPPFDGPPPVPPAPPPLPLPATAAVDDGASTDVDGSDERSDRGSDGGSDAGTGSATDAASRV